MEQITEIQTRLSTGRRLRKPISRLSWLRIILWIWILPQNACLWTASEDIRHLRTALPAPHKRKLILPNYPFRMRRGTAKLQFRQSLPLERKHQSINVYLQHVPKIWGDIIYMSVKPATRGCFTTLLRKKDTIILIGTQRHIKSIVLNVIWQSNRIPRHQRLPASNQMEPIIYLACRMDHLWASSLSM